jgi:hypothetical protein
MTTQNSNTQSPDSSSTASRAGNFDLPKTGVDLNPGLAAALGLTGPKGIPLVENRSPKGKKSWIASGGYRPSTKEMCVTTEKAAYVYSDVPTDIGSVFVAELKDEDRSAGEFFAKYIKSKFTEEKFPIGEEAPAAPAVAQEPEDAAEFFLNLNSPGASPAKSKSQEVDELLKRTGVEKAAVEFKSIDEVAASTLGAMEALEKEPTAKNAVAFGNMLDDAIGELDAIIADRDAGLLDGLPETPNLPVDNYGPEEPDREPVLEDCHYCGKTFPIAWNEVATPIGGKPVCTTCWDNGKGRENADAFELREPITPEIVSSIPVALPDNKIETILKKANIDAAAIAAIKQNFSLELGPNWKDASLAIVVEDESQTDLMSAAREMRLALRRERLRVENTRKTLKESSLRTGQAIDAVAKLLKDEIEPVEKHLEAQEKFAELAQAKRAAELCAKRSEELSHFDVEVSAYPLGTMSEDAYQLLLRTSKTMFEEKQEELRQAEAARIAKEQEDAAERQRLREENARLAAANAEANRKAAEAQAEIDRQARQKDEAERYAAALQVKKQTAPDTQKVLDLAKFLDEDIEYPNVTDGVCYALVQAARHTIEGAATELRRQVEVLCQPK